MQGQSSGCYGSGSRHCYDFARQASSFSVHSLGVLLPRTPFSCPAVTHGFCRPLDRESAGSGLGVAPALTVPTLHKTPQHRCEFPRIREKRSQRRQNPPLERSISPKNLFVMGAKASTAAITTGLTAVFRMPCTYDRASRVITPGWSPEVPGIRTAPPGRGVS